MTVRSSSLSCHVMWCQYCVVKTRTVAKAESSDLCLITTGFQASLSESVVVVVAGTVDDFTEGQSITHHRSSAAN